MTTNILQQIGLSPNEAKIYEALLDLKEAGVGEISTQTKIHRRNIYDTLNRLINKGLVFPILEKGENLYSPVDPDKLMELIKEKEMDLEKILPDLRLKFQKREPLQEAYIYRGIEGMKNYMRDILRECKDVYFIGGKLIWFAEPLKAFTKNFFEEAKRKDIKFHCVFDADVKKQDRDSLKYFGANYKFLPPQFSTNSAIVIFGNYVVSYANVKIKELKEELTIFVLKDKNLAESYRTWFNFLYDKCQKVPQNKKEPH